MRITKLSREEKGKGGDRGDLGRKGRVKRGEIIKSVITPLRENGY